jgi:hypothetical protein
MQFSSDDASVYLVLLAVAAPLLGVCNFLMTRLRRHKIVNLLRRATIIAEYQIPANLTPAEMGYMYELRLSRRQLVATLFNLEYRGIITIDEKKQVSLIGKDLSKLLPHEWMITKLLDDAENKSLPLDDFLGREHMREFEKRVRTSLVSKGFIKSNSIVFSLTVGWLKMLGVLVFGVGTLFLAYAFFAMQSTTFSGVFLAPLVTLIRSIIFLPLNALFAAVLIVVHIYVSGQSGLGTESLLRIWPKIEAYREFVREVEDSSLRYANQDLYQKTFERSAAYALALGIRTDWQSRFVKVIPQLKIAEA